MVTPVEIVLSSVGIGFVFSPFYAWIGMLEGDVKETILFFLGPPVFGALLSLWILLVFYTLSFIAGVLQ